MADMIWTPTTQSYAIHWRSCIWTGKRPAYCSEAGINLALVRFSDNAANNWYEIIRKRRLGWLVPLIEQAIGESRRTRC